MERMSSRLMPRSAALTHSLLFCLGKFALLIHARARHDDFFLLQMSPSRSKGEAQPSRSGNAAKDRKGGLGALGDHLALMLRNCREDVNGKGVRLRHVHCHE